MNDILEHVGVLGMKWGRRKGRKTTSKLSRSSEDYTTKELLKRKNIKTLSNAEIKKITERMQLERQYKELTKRSMSPGKKFVLDLLQNTAKEVATSYVKKHVMKAIAK
jgi:5-methylthioribose kinase